MKEPLKHEGNDTSESAPDENGGNRRPDVVAYQIRDRGPDKPGIWNEIGVGWRHQDGQGVNLEFSSLPVNGKVTLRDYVEQNHGRQDRSTQEGSKQVQERQHGPAR